MLGSPKFPPPEKGLKTDQKICCPRQVKKEKTPHLTRRGNSNVLSHGPIILVLTVPEYDEQDISAQPIAPPRTRRLPIRPVAIRSGGLQLVIATAVGYRGISNNFQKFPSLGYGWETQQKRSRSAL